MPLPQSEILEFRNDTSSDKLLWQVVSRYISLMLFNPAELGVLTGRDGNYIPTENETTLARQEVDQPGIHRGRLEHQIYMNINSLIPAEINTREELMEALGSNSIESHFYAALAQFAPAVVDVIIAAQEARAASV